MQKVTDGLEIEQKMTVIKRNIKLERIRIWSELTLKPDRFEKVKSLDDQFLDLGQNIILLEKK